MTSTPSQSELKASYSLCSSCQIAQQHYAEGKAELAERNCLSMLASDPSHIENILLLAAIYYARGVYDRCAPR